MNASNPRLGRLRWRGRRGMKELDQLFADFLDSGEDLDDATLGAIERLLGCQDTDLLDWLLGRSAPEDPELAAIVERIRASRLPV